MMEYKRLTHRNGKTIEEYCEVGHCKYADFRVCNFKWIEHNVEDECVPAMIERLAELEDDLESGKIIRLSCKIGDTVWVITECYNSIKGKNNYFINKRKVEAIEFNDRCFLLLCNDGGHYILGRRTFLTREEAEAKLLELQNK